MYYGKQQGPSLMMSKKVGREEALWQPRVKGPQLGSTDKGEFTCLILKECLYYGKWQGYSFFHSLYRYSTFTAISTHSQSYSGVPIKKVRTEEEYFEDDEDAGSG